MCRVRRHGKSLLVGEQPSHSLDEASIALRDGKAFGVELPRACVVGCARSPAPRLPLVALIALGASLLAEGGRHGVAQLALVRLLGLAVPSRYLDGGQVSPRLALLLSPVGDAQLPSSA